MDQLDNYFMVIHSHVCIRQVTCIVESFSGCNTIMNEWILGYSKMYNKQIKYSSVHDGTEKTQPGVNYDKQAFWRIQVYPTNSCLLHWTL